MNYDKIYNDIVNRGKNREPLSGYFEKHHIIPKCMGGPDDLSNIVQLTPEEHYVCHQLLIKIYPKNYKLLFAANVMATGDSRNNKLYGWIRRKLHNSRKPKIEKRCIVCDQVFYILPHQEKTGRCHCSTKCATVTISKKATTRKMPDHVREALYNSNKGTIKTDEVRNNMRIGRQKYLDSIPLEEREVKLASGMKGKKHTEEALFKMKQRVFHHTEESKNKISEANKGKRRSPETIERMKELKLKNRTTLTCPHCNKLLMAQTAKRWHFDNCKFYQSQVDELLPT